MIVTEVHNFEKFKKECWRRYFLKGKDGHGEKRKYEACSNGQHTMEHCVHRPEDCKRIIVVENSKKK